MIAHRSIRLSRIAIILFGCAVGWVMGVRAPRAASFEAIAFAGKGRATLAIDEVATAPAASEEAGAAADPPFKHLEVFAAMTFGTRISAFGNGLYMRSSFTLPRTGESAALVLDVDRAQGRTAWAAGAPALRARLYTVPAGGGARFDGAPVSGSLRLEAAVVGRQAAGFRIRGWLEMVDTGPDGEADTTDDRALEVEITFESLPTPEEIAGQPAPAPRQPEGGFCDVRWCWTDGAYYDGYSYGYGCGNADAGYDATSGGCADDTTGDGTSSLVGDGTSGVFDDGTTGSQGATGAPGTEAVSTDGCGNESVDPGAQNQGCGGTDAGSQASACGGSGGDAGGCSDSGAAASGCGSSGCEGDTLGNNEDLDANEGGLDAGRSRHAGLDIVGLGLFFAAMATWLSDRRRR